MGKYKVGDFVTFNESYEIMNSDGYYVFETSGKITKLNL